MVSLLQRGGMVIFCMYVKECFKAHIGNNFPTDYPVDKSVPYVTECFNYYFLKSKISAYTNTNVVLSVTFWIFRMEAKVVGVLFLVESPGSCMANYHIVEHGETHFAKSLVFEDLAKEKWKETHAAYDVPVSLAIALSRHSRESCDWKIRAAWPEINTYDLNSLCLRKTKSSRVNDSALESFP